MGFESQRGNSGHNSQHKFEVIVEKDGVSTLKKVTREQLYNLLKSHIVRYGYGIEQREDLNGILGILGEELIGEEGLPTELIVSFLSNPQPSKSGMSIPITEPYILELENGSVQHIDPNKEE